MMRYKLNGTQQEFSQESYECLQNSQQYGSRTIINGNIGIASSELPSI